MTPDTIPGGVEIPAPPVGLTTSYIVELPPSAAATLASPIARADIIARIKAGEHAGFLSEDYPIEAIAIVAIEASLVHQLINQ